MDIPYTSLILIEPTMMTKQIFEARYSNQEMFNQSIVKAQPDDGPTIGERFAGMWRAWRDGLLSRDMDWVILMIFGSYSD